MKTNEEILGNVLIIAGVILLAPMVIGGLINLAGNTYVGIANVGNKIMYIKKIKKGLKDGSIIVVDGKYYEVEIVEKA